MADIMKDLLAQLSSEADRLILENKRLRLEVKELGNAREHRYLGNASRESGWQAPTLAVHKTSTDSPMDEPATSQKRRTQTRSQTAARGFIRRGGASQFLINPQKNSLMVIWEPITTIALLWVAFVTPVQVGLFNMHMRMDVLFALSLLVDLIFICDMLLQFFLMYPKQSLIGGEPSLERRHHKIIEHYLRTWFIVDLVTALPYDLLSEAFKAASRLKSIKLLRTLRLLKFVRMFKASRLCLRVEVSAAFPYSKMQMLELSMLLIVVCHWCACVWALTATWFGPSENQTWVDAIDATEAYLTKTIESPFRLYVASFWFSCYTMTSVGPSDINARNLAERVVSILIVLCSGITWAYILARLFALVSTHNMKQHKFHQKMENLNRMLKSRRFPADVGLRVRTFFVLSKSSTHLMTQKELLQNMSAQLQGEVSMIMNKPWIANISFLKDFFNEVETHVGNQSFNAESYRACMVSISLRLDSIVFSRGDSFTHLQTLHILCKGMVVSKSTTRIFQVGSVWCEDFLLTDFTLIERFRGSALLYSEALCIEHDIFYQIVDHHAVSCPAFQQAVRRSVVRLAARRGILAEAERRRKLIGSQRQFNLKDWGIQICVSDGGTRLTSLASGVDIDAYEYDQEARLDRIGKRVLSCLPDCPRVCILGGTKIYKPSSEDLVVALAREFRRRLNNAIVVLTGGMPGVQHTFSHHIGKDFGTLVHLLPTDHTSDFDVGKDILKVGDNLTERVQLFANVGHIYLTIEGGPGVAKEAKQAFERGAVVLPMMSTEGASSGLHGFPPDALERPAWISEDAWSCMQLKSDPEASASAVVDVIQIFIRRWKAAPRTVLEELLKSTSTAL